MKLEDFDQENTYKKQTMLDDYADISDFKWWVKRVSIAVGILVVAGMSGCPMYNVWEQSLAGKAELVRAEQNRQILINEAKAKEQSSVHWANAEVERAKGAAQANQIVADSLGGSEGYLRWLFIEKLDEIKSGQVIYLPTEAGIPILEASRIK